LTPLRGQLRLDLQRDATAADLIADADRVKCPLGCKARPSFAGRRNRLHRFFCGECKIEFELVMTPYDPRGRETS
jgi:hypothetical protein